jgi:hypothetical protein
MPPIQMLEFEATHELLNRLGRSYPLAVGTVCPRRSDIAIAIGCFST